LAPATTTMPRALLGRVYLRSLALQASWNDERMQNLGLLAALAPWLRRQGFDVARRRRFCQRHIGGFNTNPYLANLVIGGILRLESEVAPEGTAPAVTSVAAYRDTLARVCGSLGDQLFWLGLRPALAMLTILLGICGQWGWLLAVVGLFGVAQLALRWYWLGAGYGMGLDIVELLSRPAWHRTICWVKRGALALTGLVAGGYIAGILAGQGPDLSSWRLATGVVLGFALPLLLRQRLPGEAQVIVGFFLAWAAAGVLD
jgi:mannose/fructose/N-acetylgalactosamine-specific phosphotransferase system component IID